MTEKIELTPARRIAALNFLAAYAKWQNNASLKDLIFLEHDAIQTFISTATTHYKDDRIELSTSMTGDCYQRPMFFYHAYIDGKRVTPAQLKQAFNL